MVAEWGRAEKNLVHALNEEWATLADDPDAGSDREFDCELGSGSVRTNAELGGLVRRWAARHDVLAGCRTPAEVLARISSRPDAVLGLLVARDQAGEALAGRIVLQAMLGKMVLMARQDPMAEVDDYVTQLWCRLHGYPLARRPRRIAANLALDTLKAVHAERPGSPDGWPAGRGCPDEPWDELAEVQPNRPVDLSAVRVLRTATELGLIDDSTHWLLAAVYADGWSGQEVAARLQVSHETVRFRCSKAVRGLAREAVSLAAAA